MADQILQELQFIAAAIIVLYLPGYTWQAWFPQPQKDDASRLAEAVALSVAFTGLVALLAFELRLSFSPASLVGLYAALATLALAGRVHLRQPIRPKQALGITLLALVAWILWRLYQARTLVLPAWVDSVHHVLIVQTILERGGLPADLTPYLPVPFYYHYGFHIVAADLSFWSRLAPAAAVLVYGQVLNALIGLSIYALGMQIWRDWKRAGAAALLVTLAFHMPAYYLTWGRYTLITGLVVLPLAMSAAVQVARQTERRWEPAARLAILTGGLFVSHYLAAELLGIFLLVLGVQRLWLDWRARAWQRIAWVRLVSGVALGVLLALPWMLRVWQYSAGSFHVDAVLDPAAPDQLYFSGYGSYLIYLAGPWRNHFLLILGGLGALFALRRSAGRLIAIWGLILLSLSLPWGLRLGPFRPDHMVIILFLPACLLAADLLFSAGEATAHVFQQRWAWPLATLVVLSLCVWGVLETRDILNPSTILVDREDLAAIQWVQANTPQDARFFINTVPWQGVSRRGVDGGWWLLPLTGRQTELPPVIYDWGIKDYVSQVRDWADRAGDLTSCSAQFWNLMVDAHLKYVYLHQGLGSLQPDALQSCADVY
ncbi:MAG: hypothetical protein PHQ40_16045, partial [Anaerolineaceae bacterium]|nr:hypothetical protein [Anaerolineaceae bacterium]